MFPITKEMSLLFVSLLGFISLFILLHLIRPKERFPYESHPILTKNEEQLYNTLLPVANKNGWMILMKMRLADIIGVRKGTDDYMRYFNKIKAKHTDFILCDPYTLEVLCGIELDDDSHKRQDRIERDEFVNKVYQAADIPLIHVWNPITEDELEEVLLEYIPSFADQEEYNSEEEEDLLPDSDETLNELMKSIEEFIQPLEENTKTEESMTVEDHSML